MSKILIVDDDVSLVDMLQEYLESQHHTVETTDDGNIALEMLKSFQYDLVILDLGIKGLSGVEVCRGYRSAGGAARILMLTGRRTIDQKEEGFNAGADDYITKPFDIREIGARVRALMRRRVDLVEDVLSFGKITLDPNTHSVTSGGSIVHLAPKEFALLEFFMRHPGEVFNTDTLLNRVWHSETDASPDTVKTCVYRLRTKLKLGDDPPTIKNIHGIGYKFFTAGDGSI